MGPVKKGMLELNSHQMTLGCLKIQRGTAPQWGRVRIARIREGCWGGVKAGADVPLTPLFPPALFWFQILVRIMQNFHWLMYQVALEWTPRLAARLSLDSLIGKISALP